MLWRFRGWTSDVLSTEQIPETNDRVLRILHEVWPSLIAYVLRNCASNFVPHKITINTHHFLSNVRDGTSDLTLTILIRYTIGITFLDKYLYNSQKST